MLVYPSPWDPPGALDGADEIHHQLVQWLEALGLRSHPRSSAEPVAVSGAAATP
jgi:hypothetical protein